MAPFLFSVKPFLLFLTLSLQKHPSTPLAATTRDLCMYATENDCTPYPPLLESADAFELPQSYFCSPSALPYSQIHFSSVTRRIPAFQAMDLERPFSSYWCVRHTLVSDYLAATAECTAPRKALASSLPFPLHFASSPCISPSTRPSQNHPLLCWKRTDSASCSWQPSSGYKYQSSIFFLHKIHPEAFPAWPIPHQNGLTIKVGNLRPLSATPARESLHTTYS